MSYSLLVADDDIIISGDIGSENIETPLQSVTAQPEQKGGPFRVEVAVDAIGRARLSKHHLHHQHLSYFEVEVNGTLVFYYNPEPIEVAYFTAGYNFVDLDWNNNPYFRQQDFNNLTLALGGVSKRFDKWLWRTQILTNINVNHMNFNEYLSWDLLLWGRYKYNDDVNLHMGAYAWVGMRINRLIPLLGFDWHINEKWKLNAVFPVNMSLVYHINKDWSLALAARAFSSRNRLRHHENLSKGIYEYRSGGSEINLRYKNEDWIPLESHVHIGCDFGGQLKVSNRHHKHGHTFDIGSALYVGGEFSARF